MERGRDGEGQRWRGKEMEGERWRRGEMERRIWRHGEMERWREAEGDGGRDWLVLAVFQGGNKICSSSKHAGQRLAGGMAAPPNRVAP